MRGGKTYAGVVEFCRRIALDLANGKGVQTTGYGGKRRRATLHYWVVAPISDLLRETMRYFFEIIPHGWIKARSESENSVWLHGNDRGDVLIEFKSADNPKHLVSVSLDGMLVDEAARIKPEAWMGGLRPRLTDKRGWAIFCTTPLGRNWLYEEIYRRGDPNDEKYDATGAYENVTWVTEDNPFIDRDEIQHAKATLPPRYYAREYLASYDAFSGTVFEEFDPKVHVVTENEFRLRFNLRDDIRSVFRRIVAGVDWGWTSAGAIIVVGDLGGGRCVVLDESYGTHKMVVNLHSPDSWVSEARRLRDKWGISQFYCDPARPEFISAFSIAGLPVSGAINDVQYGIRKVLECMHVNNGTSNLMIFADCRNLLREIPMYVWDEIRGSENFKETVAKNQSDHAIDALRYALVPLTHYTTESQAKEQPRFVPAGRGIRGPVR